jgi:hypothetical protein
VLTETTFRLQHRPRLRVWLRPNPYQDYERIYDECETDLVLGTSEGTAWGDIAGQLVRDR